MGCNPTVVAPEFTGTDNCEGTITPVVSTDGPENTGCAYTQTWTANYTDACGNVADEISITYTWTVDTEKPVLATTASDNDDLGCNPTVVAPEFTGTDNCEGTITPVVSTAGPENTGCAYTQTWTANYTDACGNVADEISITYTWTVDTEKPVLATTASDNDDLGCNPTVVAPEFTGTDNCEGTITPVVSTAGPENTGCAYTQTWTANYTDACGNVADEISVTYTWTEDTDAPVVTLNGDAVVNICQGESYTDAGATASDICSGDISGSIVMTGSVDTNVPDTYILYYNVEDACGNEATEITRTVVVESTPGAGTLTKSPNETSVCAETDVSATLTAGSGGNGTDELEYRTNDGTDWTSWATYNSGTDISTTGLTEVQIRTRRRADYCDDSDYNTVSWTVNPLPAINLTSSSTALCRGELVTYLNYSSATGDTYNIDFDVTAEGQGFDDAGGSLTGGEIEITVPGSAQPDTYSAELTVTNSTTGCTSEVYNITIIIHPLPATGEIIPD